jgi:hypothetical protein
VKNKDGQFAFSDNPVDDHAAKQVYDTQQEQQFKPCGIVNMGSGSFWSEIIFYKCGHCNTDSQGHKDQSHEPE